MKQFKQLITTVILFFLLAFLGFSMNASEKPRFFVLTNIENDPDDAMSLGRFLKYSNQLDIEILVATTSIRQKKEIATWLIYEFREAHGKVRDNLEKLKKGFPGYWITCSWGTFSNGVLNDKLNEKKIFNYCINPFWALYF